MRIRNLLAATAVAALTLGLSAGPAAADHTKGKKYLGVELTREAAIAADDTFGVAPEGSSGAGALYANLGQDRFCAFLDFTLPEGVAIVAMHLHEKVPGTQNGPVVIQLSGLLAEDGQSAQGCVEGVGSREFIQGVLSEPEDYYVNAHTNVDDPSSPISGLSVVRTELGHN